MWAQLSVTMGEQCHEALHSSFSLSVLQVPKSWSSTTHGYTGPAEANFYRSSSLELGGGGLYCPVLAIRKACFYTHSLFFHKITL